jgi:hypothetical protein
VGKSDAGAHGPVDGRMRDRASTGSITRTGRIADVKVGEALEPVQVETRVGDEVRWINTRSVLSESCLLIPWEIGCRARRDSNSAA